MAYTAPKTYAVGDVLTASDMNTYQRDNTIALYNMVQFIPLTTPLSSTNWDGDAKGLTAATVIDFNTVFGVPSGAIAVAVAGYIADGGDCFFGLSPTGKAKHFVRARCKAGSAVDVVDFSGWVPLSANSADYAVITGAIDAVDMMVTGYWI